MYSLLKLAATLKDIRTRVQRNFPIESLRGCRSALCLLGTASNGRCDFIHVRDAGVSDVTVVDASGPKIAVIKTICPSSWTYLTVDPLRSCADFIRRGCCFDAVVCDGSGGIIDHLWEDLFPFLCGVASSKVIIKAHKAYLEERGVAATRDGIRDLVARLHGLEATPDDLILRSSAHGGTYWIAFSKGHVHPVERGLVTQVNAYADTDEVHNKEPYGSEHCVQLSDLWGAPGCQKLGSCAEIVNKFRNNSARKRSQSIYRVYTSREFSSISRAAISESRFSAACFDLSRFASMVEVLDAARTVTEKKGRVIREINKAQRNGFFVKTFNPHLFVPDVHAIHHSKDIRGGKPLRASYQQSVEEMGGPPREKHTPELLPCPVHQHMFWGVFMTQPGYTQGDVVTDERLVGYIHLYRYGDHCWYARIMGHGDYLAFGIMYLLHFRVIEEVMRSRDTGLRYVFYGGISSGPRDGSLRLWKTRALFEPKYIIYNEAGDWNPADGLTLR